MAWFKNFEEKMLMVYSVSDSRHSNMFTALVRDPGLWLLGALHEVEYMASFTSSRAQINLKDSQTGKYAPKTKTFFPF